MVSRGLGLYFASMALDLSMGTACKWRTRASDRVQEEFMFMALLITVTGPGRTGPGVFRI